MRLSVLWLSIGWLVACDGGERDDEPTTCAPEGWSCNSCLDGVYTCAIDDIEETRPGCGDCQARAAVFDALCDAGRDEPVADVDAAMECQRDGDASTVR